MVGLEKRGYDDAYRIGSDGATSHSVSGELCALVTRSPQAASQPNGKLLWCCGVSSRTLLLPRTVSNEAGTILCALQAWVGMILEMQTRS